MSVWDPGQANQANMIYLSPRLKCSGRRRPSGSFNLGSSDNHVVRKASIWGSSDNHVVREASIQGSSDNHVVREALVWGSSDNHVVREASIFGSSDNHVVREASILGLFGQPRCPKGNSLVPYSNDYVFRRLGFARAPDLLPKTWERIPPGRTAPTITIAGWTIL